MTPPPPAAAAAEADTSLAPASAGGQRTALVSGSSNGIGEAIVRGLAKLDYKLVVTGRNQADIKRVADACCQLSPSKSRPLEVVADFELERDIDRLFKCTMDHFGGRLDLLVNNAGWSLPVEHDQFEACYESYRRTMQINLSSAVRLTLLASGPLKLTARRFNGGQPSAVINIGSIAALRPTQSKFAYATSKAALAMFSDCLAAELAPLVRVNCINPGPIETKIVGRSGFSLRDFKEATEAMAPLRRIGQPEDVAELALFLADQARASYITGAQITLDGGIINAPMRFSLAK